MALIGKDMEQGITSRFERHVSSGKVAFFDSVEIEFVAGKGEADLPVGYRGETINQLPQQRG